jgi:hypothetical protein
LLKVVSILLRIANAQQKSHLDKPIGLFWRCISAAHRLPSIAEHAAKPDYGVDLPFRWRHFPRYYPNRPSAKAPSGSGQLIGPSFVQSSEIVTDR